MCRARSTSGGQSSGSVSVFARRRRGEAALAALLVVLVVLGARGAAGEDIPPAICPPPPARCYYNDSILVNEQYFYNIDGQTHMIEFTGAYLKLECKSGLTLDSASLPRFPERMRVQTVVIQGCTAPQDPYWSVLNRLNVTVLYELHLQFVPPAPPLRADHFNGLHKLQTLKVSAERRKVLYPHLNLLMPLLELRKLWLLYVRLQPEAVGTLPPNLTFLSLINCQLHEVSGPALGRLAALGQLELRDPTVESPPPLEEAPALRTVELNAPLKMLPTFENLEYVTLVSVRNVTLQGSCDSLQQLHVRSVPALPANWLQTADGGARCPRLRELSLKMLHVKSLPESLLAGDELVNLTVTDCLSLNELPEKLFLSTGNLRRLVIKNNKNLTDVQGQIFTPLRYLEELDLSHNKLKDGAPGGRLAGLLKAVGALTELRKLVLDRNEIGDMCRRAIGTATSLNYSQLVKLIKLKMLSLAHTGASLLCEDWRTLLPALTTIDFSYNKLTSLTYPDLQWYDSDREVNMEGNPLRVVTMSRDEYSLDFGTTTKVELNFNKAKIDCTCDTYWTARALREGHLRAKLLGVKCLGTDVTLDSAPLVDMTCDMPAWCDDNCTCTLRHGDGDTAAAACHGRSTLRRGDGDTVAVACRGRSTLPNLKAAVDHAAHVELNLAGNNLTTLPADLPPSLQVLDLRNNSVAALPAAAAAALLAHSRRVLLAGNPLACECDVNGTRPALLRELLVTSGSADLSELRCADGTRVGALPPCAARGRGAWLWAAGGAAAVLVLALLVTWVLTRRGGKLRFKVFLFTRGLFTACVAPDDHDDSKYDVYVAFSRHDFAIAEQIIAQLESGRRPLRVCSSHRDWCFGEDISVQISRSVRQSRRTLVLVSDHFARSKWRRAVLREAWARALCDAEPRLLVVRVQPALPPGLDPELRRHITSNTYAHWGEPTFWERLRLVLPPGRPARPARSSPPAPQSLVTTRPAPLAPLQLQPSSTTPVINLSQMMEFPSRITKDPPSQRNTHEVYTSTIHKL